MPDNCFAVITVDAVNVRVQPRTSTSIVGILSRGDRIPVHEVSAPDAQNFRWVRVTVPANNQRGWIREDLIILSGDCESIGALSSTVTTEEDTVPDPTETVQDPPDVEQDVLMGDCKGEITVLSATVRSGPALSNSIRGFVNRGTSFVITEISAPDDQGFQWYELDYKGEPGWIREDLAMETGDCLDLRTHSEPEPQPEPTPTGCRVGLGLPRVSVRAQPTTNSARLGMAEQGQEFTVQEITPPQSDGFTWTQVDFNGQTGFIRSDLVVLRGNCSNFTNDARLPRPVAGRITQGFRPAHNPTHNGVDFGTGGPQELRSPLPAFVDRAHPCTRCTEAQPNIFTNDPAQMRQIFSDAGWGFGYGNHIILRHNFSDVPRSMQEQIIRLGGNEDSFIFVLYAHLSQMFIQAGQTIGTNTVIGITGNTGFSTAEHLHLEVAFGRQWGRAQKIHPATLFGIEQA